MVQVIETAHSLIEGYKTSADAEERHQNTVALVDYLMRKGDKKEWDELQNIYRDDIEAAKLLANTIAIATHQFLPDG